MIVVLKNIYLISCFFYELSGFDQHPKQKIGKHNDSYGLSCSNYNDRAEAIMVHSFTGIYVELRERRLQNVIEICNRVENSKMYELYLPYSNAFYI